MSSGPETEAQVGFLFHVMIGINPLGEFRSVKGIGRNVEKTEIAEGGRNHSPHTRVGRAKYKECTIEWGMSNRTTLFDWIHAVEAGYGYKRLVWVLQLGRDRAPLRIYQLMDAWPISWEGAELDANNNVVDTEQITIAYEAVTLLTMPSTSFNLPSFSIPEVTAGDNAEVHTQASAAFGTNRAASSSFNLVDFDGHTARIGTAVSGGEDEKEELSTIGMSLDYFVTRTEPIRIRFTSSSEDEEEEEDEGAGSDTEANAGSSSSGDGDEPAPDENTDESEPTSERPGPLKMSGGVMFGPTVFTRPTFTSDEEEEDDG